MFKPARMKKLKVITLDKYTDSAVKSLHEAGIVEIQDISERIQQDAEWRQILKPSHVSPYTGRIASLLMKTTGTMDFLKSVRRKDAGILALVKGLINPPPITKVEVEHLDVQDLIEKAEKTIGDVESKTKPLENKLNELDSEKTKLENAKKVAQNLINFDVDIADLEESKYISVIAGKVSTDSYDNLMGNLKGLTDEVVVFDADSEEKTFKIVIIIALNQYKDELSSLIRKMEFERFDISGISGKPNEIIQKSESKIESIETEKKSVLNDLADISEQWMDEIIALKEQLEIEKQRSEISSSFGQTEKTVMFEGWVTTKKLDEALEIIESSTEGYSIVDVSDPDVEKDKIPVHLDNPRWAKPYEMFVHMYSPPDYREVDPTILMALVFPFFFGFCLTDAGYGLADAIIGFIIFRGLGRSSTVARNLGLIMVSCGLWAVILGFMTNSFLGNLYPWLVLGNAWGGALPTTINSVNSFGFPQNILIMALIVGILHINMGLIIGAYNNIVRGDTREALGSQIPWFVLEAGIILYLVGGLYVGGPVAAAAVLMLVYFNGFFGIMDISGFLGNILSYARLLALCLSTGGIASTVNTLTGLSYEMLPIIGIVVAPIIWVGGQIANGAFQTLGAFINSLRLHYVEYFAQFYIGGSQKFRAFKTKRKYTDIRRL
ncbi:MAG TPA: V-type ATP synthase subunit I [Methanobacterium sp.]|nr:V-type ATP synthase subunit I [Methanobacterium sp.]